MINSRIIIITVITAVVILLSLPHSASTKIKAVTGNIFAPFQNTLYVMRQAGDKFFTAVLHPHRSLNEKKQLLTEVAELRLKLNENENIRRENETLRKMINFRNKEKYKLLICEVIARNGTDGWWQTVTINRGKNDGITPGLAVITTDGLVGRINSVAANTSTIQLITDFNCNISCFLPHSKTFGIATGKGISINDDIPLQMLAPANPLDIKYMSKNSEIKAGDKVLTSGLGEVFPAGLTVGRIIESKLVRSGLFRVATIAPAADLASLKYVFVIITEKQTEKIKNGSD